MSREYDSIDPIQMTLKLGSTPQAAHRAITSQTELRKWWAPRVIMSRNIVSQVTGKDMEMKILMEDKYRLIRFTWRGLQWKRGVPETVISYEITDLGAARGSTGQGIQIDVNHDGWSDPEERSIQEKIWQQALPGLRALLEGKKFVAWWEDEQNKSGDQGYKTADLKAFLERSDKEGRGKNDRKKSIQAIWKICQSMDGLGEWIVKESTGEFELRARDAMIFASMKGGILCLNWRELEKLLGRELVDFANRLSLEQDLDLQIGKTQEKIVGRDLNPDLFSKWLHEVLAHKKTEPKKRKQ
ncbi:MAG: SRPBCC domain-containing protein [Leptospirales bacterium]|nr:SRPBCC domain-containing protein [Leptospirales bacterium]